MMKVADPAQPNMHQYVYRWYYGANESAVAGNVTNITAPKDDPYYVSIAFNNSGAGTWRNKYLGLQYSLNGGSWTSIDDGIVQVWNDPDHANMDAVTTPNAVSGAVYVENCTTKITVGAGVFYEAWFAVNITGVSNGDNVDFKGVATTAACEYSADLNQYTEIPNATAFVPPPPASNTSFFIELPDGVNYSSSNNAPGPLTELLNWTFNQSLGTYFEPCVASTGSCQNSATPIKIFNNGTVPFDFLMQLNTTFPGISLYYSTTYAGAKVPINDTEWANLSTITDGGNDQMWLWAFINQSAKPGQNTSIKILHNTTQ
jgi:hypothetical protein